jgi:hypothetical protein
MAAALSTGVFAPRIVDAEEMSEELSVRYKSPVATCMNMEALRRQLDWWTDGM